MNFMMIHVLRVKVQKIGMDTDNFLATNSLQWFFLIKAGLHNPDENVYLYILLSTRVNLNHNHFA